MTDTCYVLTEEYNDYDQHGEYFVAVFKTLPTKEQIDKIICYPYQTVKDDFLNHILNGGGRIKYEGHWYNLREVEYD